MEKIYLSQEEYEAVTEKYHSKNGFEEMSEEEKEAYNEKLDKVVGVKDDIEENDQKTNDTDQEASESSDTEKFQDEMKFKYGYDDMSDEQKQDFDDKLDKLFDTESSEGEPGEEEATDNVKVLKRTR